MRTQIKSLMIASSLAMLLGSINATAANLNTGDAEQLARETGQLAGHQARERAAEAEANRSSEPNAHEFQAREQAYVRQQQARKSGANAESVARERHVGMERPVSVERPISVELPVTVERPISVERPVTVQRPVTIERPSFSSLRTQAHR